MAGSYPCDTKMTYLKLPTIPIEYIDLFWVRRYTLCGASNGKGRTKYSEILLLMTMAPVSQILIIILKTALV